MEDLALVQLLLLFKEDLTEKNSALLVFLIGVACLKTTLKH